MPETRRIALRIEGMTCGSCVARVERALSSVDGVRDARVNLTTERAVVESSTNGELLPALLRAVQDAGYDAEPSHDRMEGDDGDVLRRDEGRLKRHRQAMVQAIGIGVCIICLEYLGTNLSSTHPGGYVWWRGLQALLCAMLFVSPAGAPILIGGFRAILHRSGNMDLLIAIGVSVGFASSMVSLLTGTGHFHFDMVAMILGFISVGRYLEARSRREASGAVAALARRMPKEALRIDGDQVERVPLQHIRAGDKLRVPTDTIVPVDGRVLDGEAAIDASSVTGEAELIPARTGDEVQAGTLVREGNLTILAERVGSDSTIGRVLRAVEEAQSGKTRWQRIADRVAGVFVPIVIALSILTFMGWWLWSGIGRAELPHIAMGMTPIGWGLQCAIGVLVIACPCALGLATPTAVLVGTSHAALRGILVRNAEALERAASLDIVHFDKTGTLTEGKPSVRRVIGFGVEESEVLELAGAAEQFAQHPIAKAIVEKARAASATIPDVEGFRNHPGRGAWARFGESDIHVGSLSFIESEGIDVAAAREPHDALAHEGMTVVLVARSRQFVGLIGLADTVRLNAAATNRQLRDLGLRTAMVTGDHAASAAAIARSVAIDDVESQVTPAGKLDRVRRDQARGLKVGFVGDGINDAPALTGADVGIAFATATDVALESADITLIHDDLGLIPSAILVARRTARIIKQNLFWAFCYNIAAIPLAATGQITPKYAAAVMMFSSISVVLNSLRLRKVARPHTM